MERLTECVGFQNGKPIFKTKIDMRKMGAVDKLKNALGAYEDLEEQGKLIKLPCKVGDRVYVRTQSGNLAEGEVRDFSYFLTCGFCVVVTSTAFDKQHIPFSEFGKTIFISEPEAEEALQRKEAGKAHEKEKEQPETE